MFLTPKDLQRPCNSLKVKNTGSKTKPLQVCGSSKLSGGISKFGESPVAILLAGA